MGIIFIAPVKVIAIGLPNRQHGKQQKILNQLTNNSRWLQENSKAIICLGKNGTMGKEILSQNRLPLPPLLTVDYKSSAAEQIVITGDFSKLSDVFHWLYQIEVSLPLSVAALSVNHENRSLENKTNKRSMSCLMIIS